MAAKMVALLSEMTTQAFATRQSQRKAISTSRRGFSAASRRSNPYGFELQRRVEKPKVKKLS